MFRFLSVVMLAAVLPVLAVAGGCQGMGSSDPAKDRLTAANDAVTAIYKEVEIARDVKLITQKRITAYKPVRQAIDAALDKAGELYRAGDVAGMDAAIEVGKAAMAKLRPMFTEVEKKGG